MHNRCPIFGEREPGQYYRPRPGAYAVIRNDNGEIGIIKTPNGHFLPGGGAEANESPEQTLHRELREECAAEIEIGKLLGKAVELVFSHGEGYFEKICTFFEAAIVRVGDGVAESSHQLVWLPAQQAMEALRHKSQRWAVSAFRQR